jgi:hypothetical protein
LPTLNITQKISKEPGFDFVLPARLKGDKLGVNEYGKIDRREPAREEQLSWRGAVEDLAPDQFQSREEVHV